MRRRPAARISGEGGGVSRAAPRGAARFGPGVGRRWAPWAQRRRGERGPAGVMWRVPVGRGRRCGHVWPSRTCLVAVGELSKHIYNAAKEAGVPTCWHCADKAEAKPVLDDVVRPHATILVKASRGMALEELVDYLLTITKEA